MVIYLLAAAISLDIQTFSCKNSYMMTDLVMRIQWFQLDINATLLPYWVFTCVHTQGYKCNTNTYIKSIY